MFLKIFISHMNADQLLAKQHRKKNWDHMVTEHWLCPIGGMLWKLASSSNYNCFVGGFFADEQQVFRVVLVRVVRSLSSRYYHQCVQQ